MCVRHFIRRRTRNLFAISIISNVIITMIILSQMYNIKKIKTCCSWPRLFFTINQCISHYFFFYRIPVNDEEWMCKLFSLTMIEVVSCRMWAGPYITPAQTCDKHATPVLCCLIVQLIPGNLSNVSFILTHLLISTSNLMTDDLNNNENRKRKVFSIPCYSVYCVLYRRLPLMWEQQHQRPDFWRKTENVSLLQTCNRLYYVGRYFLAKNRGFWGATKIIESK